MCLIMEKLCHKTILEQEMHTLIHAHVVFIWIKCILMCCDFDLPSYLVFVVTTVTPLKAITKLCSVLCTTYNTPSNYLVSYLTMYAHTHIIIYIPLYAHSLTDAHNATHPNYVLPWAVREQQGGLHEQVRWLSVSGMGLGQALHSKENSQGVVLGWLFIILFLS